MPDHESAVEAWLENADTKAEMAIIAKRFPDWDAYQVVTFALLIEMLVATEIRPTLFTVVDDSEDTPLEPPGWMDDDDDKEEPWRG